tara:strand:+ start:2330 stop:3376 length:1047 start_codon:yes stop_codon:yes gene_type:complete
MTKKNSNDEIDIISLFSTVSKKINWFFYLLINLFISVLNLFIRLLVVIRKSYLLLSAAVIIGGLMGYTYQENFYKPSYTSTLTLSPNFGSTYQLYGNIDFYQNLINYKDFEKLKSYLNLDSSESKALENITIEPYTNEFLKLINYKALLKSADSITATEINYNDYIGRIPFDNYVRHLITIKLNNNKIPTQIEEKIIENIENNIYYKNKKETYLENLKIKKEFILLSLQKIDTLLFADDKDSQSDNSGTTIVLDENQNQNIDLQLFDRYTSLRNELVEINIELNDKKNVINTIDSFSKVGSIVDRYFIILTPLCMFLMSLFLILIYKLNKKLSNGSSLKIKKIDPNTE